MKGFSSEITYSKNFEISGLESGHWESVLYESGYDTYGSKFVTMDFKIGDCYFDVLIENDGTFTFNEKSPKFNYKMDLKNTSKYTYNKIKNFIENENKSPLEKFIYLANVCYELSKIAGLKDVAKVLKEELSPKHLNEIYFSIISK